MGDEPSPKVTETEYVNQNDATFNKSAKVSGMVKFFVFFVKSVMYCTC